MSQKFAAFDLSGKIIGFYDSEESPVPDGIQAIEISDIEWQDCISQQGYLVSGGVLVAPSSSALLEQAKFFKNGALLMDYKNALVTPVQFTNHDNVSKTYQADAESVASLKTSIAGYSASQETPAGFYWIAFDNTKVPFSYADLLGLAAAVNTQSWTEFQHLQAVKETVAEALTIEAVNEITW